VAHEGAQVGDLVRVRITEAMTNSLGAVTVSG
jgi:hypothetical protein